MVNHIRTLLLNETQASLQAAGLPYGVPWYVSPSFSSIQVPKGLSVVRDAMFVGAGTLKERYERVDAIMPYVEAPDLADAISFFDCRSTVKSREIGSGTIRSFFDSIPLHSTGFETGLIAAAMSCPYLFSSTGVKRIDSYVSIASGLARSSFEASIRVGGVIAAYCLQLEKERLGVENA